MTLRFDHAMHHAVRGFDMEWEAALEVIRDERTDLTEDEQTRRTILLAAFDNLVDFCVAEEYQLAKETEEVLNDYELTVDEANEEALVLCATYNKQYAFTENLDIEYAMIVAAGMMAFPKEATLMYMTQGDERVRPWHLQYEGFTAPKSQFPEWLIPPIEHQCRCYLVEVEDAIAQLSDVQNKLVQVPDIPEWFNPTFKESVALGGRIFSDEHPYFQVDKEDAKKLRQMAERIKAKYRNG